MFNLKTQDQGINILAQQDYLEVLIESFLIDRKSQGLSPDTIDFYAKKLKYFLKYCEGQALIQVSQLTTDMIRRYVLGLSETHNPGGVHACFRPLRTMLYWVEEEQIMPDGWKNPIRRVKAPRLSIEPIEPIQIEDLQLLCWLLRPSVGVLYFWQGFRTAIKASRFTLPHKSGWTDE